MTRSFFDQQHIQHRRSVVLIGVQFVLLTTVVNGLAAPVREEVAR
ncbi:MAG: hypothetical protein ACK5CE_06760 [Actinomycetes bacterium]